MVPNAAGLARLFALSAAVLLFAGCFGDSRPHVVIEFGMYPDLFEGLDVQIDGKTVGQLKKTGAITRTGWPLDKGEHTIQVLSPKFESQPYKLNAELRMQKIMLILELTDGATADGRMTQALALHP